MPLEPKPVGRALTGRANGAEVRATAALGGGSTTGVGRRELEHRPWPARRPATARPEATGAGAGGGRRSRRAWRRSWSRRGDGGSLGAGGGAAERRQEAAADRGSPADRSSAGSPRCTYGTGWAGTPLVPTIATGWPSATTAPVGDQERAEMHERDGVAVGGLDRDREAARRRPCPRRSPFPRPARAPGRRRVPWMSIPRCCPGRAGSARRSAKPCSTGPGTGHVQAPAAAGVASARSDLRRPRSG